MTTKRLSKKRRDRAFHDTFMHYFEYTLWLVTGAAFVTGMVAFARSDLSPTTVMEFGMLTAILVSEFID